VWGGGTGEWKCWGLKQVRAERCVCKNLGWVGTVGEISSFGGTVERTSD
jgi:hypothetical protein